MIAEIDKLSGFIDLYAAVGFALKFVSGSCVALDAVKGRTEASTSPFDLCDAVAD